MNADCCTANSFQQMSAAVAANLIGISVYLAAEKKLVKLIMVEQK